MAIDITETDSELPAICFCNDIIVPITSQTFVKNIISFIENDLLFKLNNITHNKLKFALEYYIENNPNDSVLGVYLGSLFMGYISASSLLIVMKDISVLLHRLKSSRCQ